MTYSRLKLIVQSKDTAGDKPTTHEFVSGTFTDVNSVLNDVVSFLKHVNDGQSVFAEPDTDFSDVSSPNLPDFGRLTDDEDDEIVHETQSVAKQPTEEDALDAILQESPDLDITGGIADDEEEPLDDTHQIKDVTPAEFESESEDDDDDDDDDKPEVISVTKPTSEAPSLADQIIDADQEPELQSTVNTPQSNVIYDEDRDEGYGFSDNDESESSDNGVMMASNFDDLGDDFSEEAPY